MAYRDSLLDTVPTPPKTADIPIQKGLSNPPLKERGFSEQIRNDKKAVFGQEVKSEFIDNPANKKIVKK